MHVCTFDNALQNRLADLLDSSSRSSSDKMVLALPMIVIDLEATLHIILKDMIIWIDYLFLVIEIGKLFI